MTTFSTIWLSPINFLVPRTLLLSTVLGPFSTPLTGTYFLPYERTNYSPFPSFPFTSLFDVPRYRSTTVSRRDYRRKKRFCVFLSNTTLTSLPSLTHLNGGNFFFICSNINVNLLVFGSLRTRIKRFLVFRFWREVVSRGVLTFSFYNYLCMRSVHSCLLPRLVLSA